MSVEFKTPSFKHLLSKGFSGCPKDDTLFIAFRVFIYPHFSYSSGLFAGAEHGDFAFVVSG